MAYHSRIEVFNKMVEAGVIPVFFNRDIETSVQILKACYAGGARVIEFTNREPLALQTFAALVSLADLEMPDLLLGVGTITDAGTASMYIQQGAKFIVSPYIKKDMALVCNRRKVLWIPGCGSLNEISKAEELGAELVKIFPAAQLGGPKFVAAIKVPCPWTNVMPTGGVELDEHNLYEWFRAGVSCVGMGSQLISVEDVKHSNFQRITENVYKALEIVRLCRNR